jgi:hypothetical protein
MGIYDDWLSFSSLLGGPEMDNRNAAPGAVENQAISPVAVGWKEWHPTDTDAAAVTVVIVDVAVVINAIVDVATVIDAGVSVHVGMVIYAGYCADEIFYMSRGLLQGGR